MIKHFLTGLLAIVLTVSHAQAQFTVGVRTGMNCTKLLGDEGFLFSPVQNSIKFGFQLGVITNYSLSENFSIESGLLFSTKGFKNQKSVIYPITGKKWTIKESEGPNYIQIPIYAKFKLGNIVLFHAGPYVGYAIGGYRKMETFEDGKRIIYQPIRLFKQDEHGIVMTVYDRKFDWGIGMGVAMKFNNIQIGLDSNIGLINVISKSNYKNGGLSLTATYMFGKK